MYVVVAVAAAVILLLLLLLLFVNCFNISAGNTDVGKATS
jgi:hypothetical protein